MAKKPASAAFGGGVHHCEIARAVLRTCQGHVRIARLLQAI